MFEKNIIHCELTYLWYAQPPVWRCFVVKVDDEFMRREHFTAEFTEPNVAMECALFEAAAHQFKSLPPIESLNLVIEI